MRKIIFHKCRRDIAKTYDRIIGKWFLRSHLLLFLRLSGRLFSLGLFENSLFLLTLPLPLLLLIFHHSSFILD